MVFESTVGGRRQQDPVRPGRLWAGGVTAAVVAALVVVVGELISETVFQLHLLPQSPTNGSQLSVGYLPLVALLVGLAATGVLHLLLAFVPMPIRFFNWLMALVLVVSVIWPILSGAEWQRVMATAVADGVAVIAIWGLLLGVARRARTSSAKARRRRQ